MAEEKNKKLSKPLTDIIEKIEKISVLELSQLVKALEERFGVTAMAPIATTPTPIEQTEGKKSTEEEKSAYDVVIATAGENKINLIKAIREIRQDIGLKEAKDMTENLPAILTEGMKIEEAQEAKKKLEETGAKVELK